jgi:hypothetical protein
LLSFRTSPNVLAIPAAASCHASSRLTSHYSLPWQLVYNNNDCEEHSAF